MAISYSAPGAADRVAHGLEARFLRGVHVVDARLETRECGLVVRMEEQQPGDVLLTGRELDRLAVVLGLRRLVDRPARLVALVQARLRRWDRGLDAELAVEHG